MADVDTSRRALPSLPPGEGVDQDERALREFIDQLPVPAQAYGTDGIVSLWNRASERLYGFAAEEAVGRNLADLVIPPDLRPHFAAALAAGCARTTSGEFIPAGEIELLRKDGARIPVYSTHTAICRPGRPPLLLCLDVDLTERRRGAEEQRRLEAKLRQTQKLESVGILAGGIAHDFNNILMTILGNADLVLDGLPEESPFAPMLEDIRRAARRAADLCQQMLAYSGKGRFQIQVVNLNDVIREMSKILDVSVGKQVTLAVDLDPDLPDIAADPTQLRQVVMNLILNGAEAIDDRGGWVTLSTTTRDCGRHELRDGIFAEDLEPGRHVVLEVTDTGAGMTEATAARIFEPFFTTKFTGRGLGLAAVLGIIRAHRGAISVRSAPGAGSTFTILLPVTSSAGFATPVDSREAAAVVEPAPPGWCRDKIVLLTDDEPDVRQVAARMLARLGCEVVTAGSGEEALRLHALHRDRIGLVVLDLTMPGLDGEHTFRELRRLDPDVRVVLSSGYNQQELQTRFVAQRFAGFIQKPYQLDELRRVLIAAVQES